VWEVALAAIDFPASPANAQIFTASNGVTYRFVTPPTPGIWTVGSVADTAFTGDTPPATPANNQLWFNATLGQLFIWYNDGNTTQWVPTAPGTSIGNVQQTVSFETGAVATGTTLLPVDDTIPQITEGNEYMTLAITPRSATSRLIVDVVVYLSHSAASANLAAALFQDATANALAAVSQVMSSPTSPVTIAFRHTMTSGTTSATTFRVRAGAANAGTVTFNGAGGGRFFGGVSASSVVIQEVMP
jgi:hypothetical protein